MWVKYRFDAEDFLTLKTLSGEPAARFPGGVEVNRRVDTGKVLVCRDAARNQFSELYEWMERA